MRNRLDRQHHPLAAMPAAFRDEIDRLDPMVCARPRLEALMAAAPTETARAWLQGIHDARRLAALVAGGVF